MNNAKLSILTLILIINNLNCGPCFPKKNISSPQGILKRTNYSDGRVEILCEDGRIIKYSPQNDSIETQNPDGSRIIWNQGIIILPNGTTENI